MEWQEMMEKEEGEGIEKKKEEEWKKKEEGGGNGKKEDWLELSSVQENDILCSVCIKSLN